MINKLKKIFSALLALAMIFGMSSLVSPAAAQKMNEWRNSLQGPSGTPTLCDFGGQEMKPIWELCSNAERAEALKNEFTKRAYSQTGYANPKIIRSFSVASKIGQGSENLVYSNVDANEYSTKAEGSRYLCYLLSTDTSETLTNLFVVYNPDYNSGWYKNAAASHYNRWGTRHNDVYGDYEVVDFNLNRWSARKEKNSGFLQVTKKYTYPSKDIVLLASYNKNLAPIKKIEVLRGLSKDQLAIKQAMESDWEWVCLQDQKTPFNLNTDVSKDYNVPAETIYVRFLRG